MTKTLKINKNKLLYYMNVRKLTPSHLDSRLNFRISELLGKDEIELDHGEITVLASVLNIDDQEILVKSESLALIYQSRKELESTKRAVYRDNIHFYNYYTLPTPKGYISPVILDILCPHDRVPQLNNGHFEEAITINLGPDDIYGRWEEDTSIQDNFDIIKANSENEHWILGDSYFEPSYCKHSYSLVKPQTHSKIISYTSYNELSRLKQEISTLSADQKKSMLNLSEFSFQYGLVEKFRKAAFMSVNAMLKFSGLTYDHYEKLKKGILDQNSLDLMADVLKIDPRLLAYGSTGGDVLGKQYMSISESKRLQSQYEGYQVAPTACSARSPDLKGSFINILGNDGGILKLQHNVHYLVTSGELLFTYWETNLNQSTNRKLSYYDSLWLSPGLKHSFQGYGSLIALTNGEKFGYLNDFALSNLWDRGEVTKRFVGNEVGWGYDK